LGIERCGKINASNSGSDSWTGIGVVAGVGAVVLFMQWPHGKERDVHWGSELLHILQEVRSNCKTRNQLNRSEKSVGIAVLAYLLVLRVCHHEIIPGKPWSIFQLQHALRLRVMTNQVEHTVKVKMAKTRKAA